jgi:hypothetical protein
MIKDCKANVKEQPCRNFKKGNCKYGDKCFRSHSQQQDESKQNGSKRFDRAFITLENAEKKDQCLLSAQDRHTDDMWVFCADGASETHLVRDPSTLKKMTNVRQVRETMFMNTFEVKITHRGDLHSKINGHVWTFKNIAFVPGSRYNLLSVSALLDVHKNASVTYTKNQISIRDGGAEIVGFRKRGLYFAFLQPEQAKSGGVKQPKSTALLAHQDQPSESSDASESVDSDDFDDEKANTLDFAYLSQNSKKNSESSGVDLIFTKTRRPKLKSNQTTHDFTSENLWDALLQHGTTTTGTEPITTNNQQEGAVVPQTAAKPKAIKFVKHFHNAWGHAGLKAVKATARRDQPLMKLTDKELTEIRKVTPTELDCEDCLLAKSRNKHPKGQSKPRKKKKGGGLDKVPPAATRQMTSDTFGPNPPATFSRHRYGHLSVVDDELWGNLTFSRHKSGASETFRDNYRVWKHECKLKPRILKTDRGGEWNSKEFNQWCARRGLRRKRTAPHSSSGTAEKLIDTLQSRAMAMRSWAKCKEDTGLWPESLKYANTVSHFLPSESAQLRGLSPYEKRHDGEKPRMHTLHAWGCLAYPHIPKKTRRRYQLKARRAMFMGLAENEDDGYRFYDADTKRFFHAKSAGFRDHIPYLLWRAQVKADEAALIRGERERLSNEGERERKPTKASTLTQEKHPTENVIAGARRRTQRAVFDPQEWELAKAHDEKRKQLGFITTCSLSRDQRSKEKREKDDEDRILDSVNEWIHKHNVDRPGMTRLKSGSIPDGRRAFIEAVTSEDRKQWILAIIQEMLSIEYKEVMRTIKRSDVPQGRKPIKARWVFDIKKNSDGSVERYKARLVAKGFLQRAGQDYTDTFAPTPSFTSVRLLTAVSLQRGWTVYHQDVKTAFLEGELEWWERVYLEAPPGYELKEDEVLALHKCLYGLKQSARKWNKKIGNVLKQLGLTQSTADKCVWVSYNKKTGELESAVAVHVDDILLTGESQVVSKIKEGLNKAFTMKDLGQLSWYLGVKFTWTEDAVYLSQEAYTKDILQRYQMSTCNPRKTPAVPGSKLTKPKQEMDKEEREWLESRGRTQADYQSVVGAIRYLADRTRPDLGDALGQLARHLRDARREHWIAAKHILGYLQGTLDHGLCYKKVPAGSPKEQPEIIGYSDSDWAGDLDDCSSTSGYVFMFLGGAISWSSKKQNVVARSSAEAELVALDLAAREALWLRKLQRDFKLERARQPLTIHEDNEAAISITEKHQRTQRTKHFKVKYFAVCKDVEERRLKIKPVASADNVSDLFTKSLGRVKFQEFRKSMGIVAVPTEGVR